MVRIVVPNVRGHLSQSPEELVKWDAGLLGLGLGLAFVLTLSGGYSSGVWRSSCSYTLSIGEKNEKLGCLENLFRVYPIFG